MSVSGAIDQNQLAQERRSDYDVTNTVQVSSVRDVCGAVRKLFELQFPTAAYDAVWLAFHDFERLFGGKHPEYHAVDTSYHDIQHTLDMTLTLARLITGHEQTVAAADRLGAERAKFTLVAALFHDSGYIRHRERDRDAVNGAVFTTTHVARSGAYLERYLPQIGLEAFVPVVARVVHFTGYEIPLEEIELDDPRDTMAGHLLGTADLLAQMADRCYLEKCRDRLYPEFVLGEVAVNIEATGSHAIYQSSRDLLQKTIDFYQKSAQARLEKGFNRAYRFIEAVFEDGSNPYVRFVRKNMNFLDTIRHSGDWSVLRRRPPCILPDPDGEARLVTLAMRRLRELADGERETSRRLRVLDPHAYEAARRSRYPEVSGLLDRH
jgi:hypothetical protein